MAIKRYEKAENCILSLFLICSCWVPLLVAWLGVLIPDLPWFFYTGKRPKTGVQVFQSSLRIRTGNYKICLPRTVSKHRQKITWATRPTFAITDIYWLSFSNTGNFPHQYPPEEALVLACSSQAYSTSLFVPGPSTPRLFTVLFQ